MDAVLASDDAMSVWWATEVECVSAIARREREGELAAGEARDALANLADLRAGWHEFPPTEAVRHGARRLLRTHPLRAPDALQLAAALVACEGDPTSLHFVSLDERLRDAAAREGFPVEPDEHA